MKVLVVGANGQIGKQVCSLMESHDTLVAKAMIRNKEQSSFFEKNGIETVIADLEGGVDEIAEAASGCNAIVFAAGSGGHTGKDKTILVDLDGAVKTIAAAKQASIDRFIMISSFDTTREAIQEASSAFAPYVACKHYADEWLKNTNLKYTIIHPGILTNEVAAGKVSAANKVARNEVARGDIASVIISCLERKSTIGKAFQVVKGDTPIDQAIDIL